MPHRAMKEGKLLSARCSRPSHAINMAKTQQRQQEQHFLVLPIELIRMIRVSSKYFLINLSSLYSYHSYKRLHVKAH